MTPEKINRIIGELEGWTLVQASDGEWVLKDPEQRWIASDFDPDTTWDSFSHLLPNYYADLNACHEVEKKLPDKLFPLFVICLQDFYLDATKGGSVIGAHSATAPQRCEAIIKTIAKWEE